VLLTGSGSFDIPATRPNMRAPSNNPRPRNRTMLLRRARCPRLYTARQAAFLLTFL
jgi:hypothetical protein